MPRNREHGREYLRQWRARNPRRVAEYNKRLNASRLNDEYRAARREWDRTTRKRETARTRDRRHARKYRQKYPEKERAKRQVRTAISRGDLKRQPCVFCGKPGHAHHPDYSKPLEVVWLCRQHHADLHNGRALKAKVK